MNFDGVKAALYHKGKLMVYQRDDKPGLRFAGLWDFFGGGRENQENEFECIARELEEELEIIISPEQLVFKKVFPAMHDPSLNAYFVVIELTDDNVVSFRFGSEGQRYKFVTVDEFLNNNDAYVPYLKPRLETYLSVAEK